MMGKHLAWCAAEDPQCLCLTCKHDSLDCCVDNAPDEPCPVSECPNYEKEDATDADAQ